MTKDMLNTKLRIGAMLLTILLLAGAKINGQQPLTNEDLAENTTYFSLENGFRDEGAALLRQEIAGAHFIAYGELHNSQQSALFFDALLKEASKSGFNNLALEIGEYSTRILERLSATPENTAANINSFFKKYGAKNYKWPIPFVKGVEDAAFLETASALNYDLWGLDHEYLFSAPILFDELILTTDATEELLDLKKEATKAWKKLKSKKRSCESLTSPEIKAFLSKFSAENEQAQAVIKGLKTAWQIYCDYEEARYSKSNTDRVSFMRENFRDNFEQTAESTGQIPKVIAKLGSYHSSRIMSPLGYKDVGNLMKEMAEKRQVDVLYIRYLRRYWQGKDKIDSKDYANSRTFLTVGKPDQWALIDLRPLREKIKSGELTVSDSEKLEIYNYDLMLMAPKDRWVKNNF
jgi:hypothetical protein